MPVCPGGIHPQALAEWLVTSEPSSDGPEQGSRPLWPVALGARAGGPVFVASAGPPPLPGWPAPLCHSRHSRQASGGRCCPCQGPSGCSRQEVSQCESGSVSAAGEVELSPQCLRESREEPGEGPAGRDPWTWGQPGAPPGFQCYLVRADARGADGISSLGDPRF